MRTNQEVQKRMQEVAQDVKEVLEVIDAGIKASNKATLRFVIQSAHLSILLWALKELELPGFTRLADLRNALEKKPKGSLRSASEIKEMVKRIEQENRAILKPFSEGLGVDEAILDAMAASGYLLGLSWALEEERQDYNDEWLSTFGD